MVGDDSNNDRTESFVALTDSTKVSHYRIISKLGASDYGLRGSISVGVGIQPPGTQRRWCCRGRGGRRTTLLSWGEETTLLEQLSIGGIISVRNTSPTASGQTWMSMCRI